MLSIFFKQRIALGSCTEFDKKKETLLASDSQHMLVSTPENAVPWEYTFPLKGQGHEI